MRLSLKHKQKLSRLSRKTQYRTKHKNNKRKTKRKKKKKYGGNILGNTMFSKIISIGFEFESPYLIPLKLKNDHSAFIQIETIDNKESKNYDIYYESFDNGNTIFNVTTDNEGIQLNTLMEKHKSKLAININEHFIPIHNIYENDPNDTDLELGHTEFITTFYKPQTGDNIIRTNMKQNIEFINNYIHTLTFIPANLYFENKTLIKSPWTLLKDNKDNYYLPTFINGPVPTTMAMIERDLRFTIQMTFNSEFIDCVDIVQALLANSKNKTIQEQSLFFSNIVNSVKDTIAGLFGTKIDVSQHITIKYLETFIILLVYRYEVYKIFDAKERKGYYKDNSYFYIRHKFDELFHLIHSQGVALNNVNIGYKELIDKYPQYKSENIISFFKTIVDPLNIEYDIYSKRYPIDKGQTTVLIEFRGFQDEIQELINTYTNNKYQSQINHDLTECSEALVGCYSLKILNDFAKVQFQDYDKKRATTMAIINAPKRSRTVKAPSKLNL